MPRYVDGFVIPVAKRQLAAYRRMSAGASKVWREYGSIEYLECAGDDLDSKFGLPFPRGIKIKPGETVVFSWILCKSRAHRDKVNAAVMNEPRIAKMMMGKKMPFDVKRMMCGGFSVMVDA